ncbi:MAG TPA: efflux RND transporter periplasmic adaptor subunit [Verrucomicrobiae bacterium]|nr:efflux RND transporter periplasmic adaptor subunit [Verrucomicrobiae bacterium]
MKKAAVVLILVCCAIAFGWVLVDRIRNAKAPVAQSEQGPAPVEVAPIERGAIEWRRAFSGTLESSGEFVVAPKISGRIERLAVDLADPVSRGQVVAELDDDEYVQEVAQAEAELAVTRANLKEAVSMHELAQREIARVQTLTQQGIGSESQLDIALADQLARDAAVQVAQAHVLRAEAAVSTARIRLGYAKVAAIWTGGSDERVVAHRHVEEGDTVAANAPLLTIVELDPIKAVIHLTGRDYGHMRAGQTVALSSDSYAGKTFAGRVTRVAPVFEEASRQARAELTVANPDLQLKPGMFVRAETILQRVENATIVPLSALTTRDGKTGVFVVSDAGDRVAWRPVEVGIRENERVQVIGDGLAGRVVTLGQQLLDDGSAITIPQRQSSQAPTAENG